MKARELAVAAGENGRFRPRFLFYNIDDPSVKSCLAATHAARWIVDGARVATATSVGLQCREFLRQQPAASQESGQELEMRGRCSCELWLGALWPACQSPSSLPFSFPIVPQAIRWASKQKPRIWSRRNSATQSTKRLDMVPSLRRGVCSWRAFLFRRSRLILMLRLWRALRLQHHTTHGPDHPKSRSERVKGQVL